MAKNEDILKQIYSRALEKRQESFSVREKGFPIIEPEATGIQPRIPAEVFGDNPALQDTATRVTETGKLKVKALVQAMQKLSSEKTAKENTEKPATIIPERDILMQELISIYRDKRQMIDDLPPQHRQLLEKMSQAILGTSKSSPKQH